jgi:hypothetical protein
MNRFLCMVAGTLAVFIAGCSGSSSSSSSVARIRAYDGATQATGAATIYINSGSANGDQNYEGVSQYLYVNSGTSTFAWAVNTLTGGLVTSFPVVLNSGSVYSAILLGNADDQFGSASPILDVTVDDQTAPPSGDANIRIIHDAPDAGPINVYINGNEEQANYAYPGTTITGLTAAQQEAGTPFSLQNFPYTGVAGGSVTIKIVDAGTSATIAGPTTFTVTAGSRYTFFVLEPTVNPAPTYTLQQITDAL